VKTETKIETKTICETENITGSDHTKRCWLPGLSKDIAYQQIRYVSFCYSFLMLPYQCFIHVSIHYQHPPVVFTGQLFTVQAIAEREVQLLQISACRSP